MPIRKISTRPPGSDRSSQLPTTKCESEAARMSGGHTTSVRGTAPPARRYCSHAPVESLRPESKVPLVPIRAATLRRSWWNSRRRCRVVCFSVPRCQDAPSPCCCPPCVRVQHGCPARCGQRQRRSVLTRRTLYYDIAFGVSGVRTDTPPYSGTLLPLCHVSAERGENFFGKAKILLR